MRKFASLLLAALLLPTLNCGGGGAPGPPPILLPAPPESTSSIAGNWEINAQAAASSGHTLSSAGIWELFGSLDIAGPQVNGVLHELSSLCYPPFGDTLSVSGTISSGNDSVSLSSSPTAGQVLTINGVMSPDRKSLLSANYTIVGGCADGEHGTMTGFLVPSFTNTYTGTFTSFPGGKTANITLSLTQSASADVSLFFPITSATATFANNACFSSGELSFHGGLVFGNHFGVNLTTSDSGELIVSGTLADPAAKTITGTYRVLSGTCANDFGFVTLTHP